MIYVHLYVFCHFIKETALVTSCLQFKITWPYNIIGVVLHKRENRCLHEMTPCNKGDMRMEKLLPMKMYTCTGQFYFSNFSLTQLCE